MASKYIKREDITKWLNEQWEMRLGSKDPDITLELPFWLVEQQLEWFEEPVSDWLYEDDDNGYYCDVCKGHSDTITPFCPHCGVEMDLEAWR